MIKKLIIFFITFFIPHFVFSSQNEKTLYPLQLEKITENQNNALLQEIYDLTIPGENILISTNTPLLYNFLISPINTFIDNNNLNISPQFFLIQKSTLEYPYSPCGLFASGCTKVFIGIHVLTTLLELSLFQGIAFWIAHEIGHLIQNQNKKLIYSDAHLSILNEEIDADHFACDAALTNEHDKTASMQALCTLLVLKKIYNVLSKSSQPSLNKLIDTMSYFIMQKTPQSYWNTIQHYEEIDKMLEVTLRDVSKNNKKDIIEIITKDDTFIEKFINQLIQNSTNPNLIKRINAQALGSLSHPSPKERFAMINKTKIVE